ncbi:hypothetical protein GE061_016150 [Apolygus lucorum]|uniref:Saposin B-type domain-containing protein n=1 Tax=Apolygus lucorum TaxID=248454 RepID=A0A8S9XFC1_APOLU|nr:hypothetical protein GE061_016150 [Apolygus lucorum]
MNSVCKLLLLAYCVCLVPDLVTSKHVICYQGQSYWCRNITTAAECNAVKHCIQSVWEKEIPIEEDKSSVCQTCMDMVKMARDQLESNETQEELRQVLEGTCMVIPEKHLKKDCDKLMDDFGSYIVDTLASQMNPSVVCSVAGLCYNDKFKNVKVVRQLDCESCHGLMKRIEGNIETASTGDLQDTLKNICGSLSSFSEICVSLLAEHMESVDALVRNNVRAEPICNLAGVCAEKFHSHSDRINLPRVSVSRDAMDVQVFSKTPVTDDLSCEFCEQLVKHLRDILIANTTEEEFKMVLEGICKMSKFKDDCEPLIDQYYEAVYNFLVKELDGKALCTQIKICNASRKNAVIQPQNPIEAVETMQLPIERMKLTYVPMSPESSQKSPAVCSFCEYFLHFVQQEITLPSSERKITEVVERGCDKLPATVRGQCDSFVDTYMDQFIAILANRIDPSQVCPSLGACSGVLLAVEYKDKPTCPLCLLAIDEALRKVASNRSEAAIGDVLDDLCMRDEFPTSVLVECAKFVTSFKQPITDMIIADFTSQEACVYVDLCSPPKDALIPAPKVEYTYSHVGDVETNQINEFGSPNVCVLCEFVMQKLSKMIADKKTEGEIKDALDKVCNHMPKTIVPQCKQFIVNYADLIMQLLISEVSPKIICTELELCLNVERQIINPVKRCVVCEIFMDFLKSVMTNEELDTSVNESMMKACKQFPPKDVSFCVSMVEQLGPQIEEILRTVPVGRLVCRRIHMCSKDKTDELHLLSMDLGGDSCYSGAEYWCATSANAMECDKIEYCQTNVWRSDKPGRSTLKGRDVI